MVEALARRRSWTLGRDTASSILATPTMLPPHHGETLTLLPLDES